MKTLPPDVSRSILYMLDDISLANACMLDKNFSNKICNDTFWINKIMSVFPLTADEIKEYKGSNSYWAYYLFLQGQKIKKLDDLLIHASWTERDDLVKIAIRSGANIHIADDAALHFAALRGNTEMVKFLLENGADLHADLDKALRWASKNGHIDTVKLLLEKDADVHAWNDFSLKHSIKNGYIEIALLLLKNGADPAVITKKALEKAIKNSGIQIIRDLYDRGITNKAIEKILTKW